MLLPKLSKDNKRLANNIFGSFAIKGLGLIINLVSMPLYLSFFEDSKALGLWFAILSVLNWILAFDMGIGNGLRNHLTTAIAHKNSLLCKQLVSSAYALLGAITIFVIILLCIIVPIIDFNVIFNIPVSVVSPQGMRICIAVTLVGIVLSFFLRLVNSILYALQLAAINNLNHLATNAFIVLFLLFAKPLHTSEENLILMGGAYALVINFPLIITTILVFSRTVLKNSLPSFAYITKESSHYVFSLGVKFLVVQILYMIITVTNDWFISYFYGAEHCVDYQIYYKIFSLCSTLLILALSPVWSAVTKALAEKRIAWLIKAQRLIYIAAFGLSLLQILIIPFLQSIINLWLKDKAIEINLITAGYFVLYSITTIWIAVQSTFAAGLGELKVQTYGFLFAAFSKIVGIVLLSRIIDDWAIVVLVTSLGLIPYCIVQPFVIRHRIKALYRIN